MFSLVFSLEYYQNSTFNSIISNCHTLFLACPFAEYHLNEAPNDCNSNKGKADLATRTPSRCTCASICHNNWRSYDWCETEGQCGKHYYWGDYYWDKCIHVADADPSYNNLTWSQKQNHIWNRALSNKTIRPHLSVPKILKELFSTSWPKMFENEWDVKPVGLQKYFHPLGSVCPIVFKIRNSNFTGILKNGEHHGIVRLSTGRYPEKGKLSFSGFGAAFKFFRTGMASANLITQSDTNLTIQDFNFLKLPLNNHISACNNVFQKFINLKFNKNLPGCQFKLGMSDFCKYDQEGNVAKNVVFPYKVYITK